MSESDLTRYCEGHDDSIAFARLASPSAAGTPMVKDLCLHCLRANLRGFDMMGTPPNSEMTVFVDVPEIMERGEDLGLDASMVDDPVAVDVNNPLEAPRSDLLDRTVELSEDIAELCRDDRLTDADIGQLRAARNILLDVNTDLKDRPIEEQEVGDD